MSSNGGPWSPAPESAPAARGRPRWALRIGVFAVFLLCLWGLSRLGGASVSGGDWGWLAFRILLLVGILSSVMARGLPGGQTARYGLAWLAIMVVLFVGYSFREDAAFVIGRVTSEIAPGFVSSAKPGELVVSRSGDGAFYVMGQVNGVPVRFLIDTGASTVVLSPADAERVGVDLASLNFVGEFETANGIGRGAPFTADSLRVGAIERTQFRMAVNRAPMSSSLLGMRFFEHLQSVELRGSKLYLRWNG